MQRNSCRTGARLAILSSLDVLVGVELDDETRLTLSMLRLLVASRLEPGETARALIQTMDTEVDEVVASASLPDDAGAIYCTVAQSVVLILEASCGLVRDIDSAGWRRPRRWSLDSHVDEREALIAHLASRLYAALLSDERLNSARG